MSVISSKIRISLGRWITPYLLKYLIFTEIKNKINKYIIIYLYKCIHFYFYGNYSNLFFSRSKIVKLSLSLDTMIQ